LFKVPFRKSIIAQPPLGIAELIICVFDEKHRLRHHFQASTLEQSQNMAFLFLNNPAHAMDSYVLSEAIGSRKPVSVSLSYGEGSRKYLYVLPYERKAGHWRYACVQVTTDRPDPDFATPAGPCAMAEERLCLMLLDGKQTVRSVGPRIPEAFGYEPENFVGMNLLDFFAAPDVEILEACSPDTNESILSCIFRCVDGSKRDVEIKKYSMPDKLSLYGICDVSPRYHIEEFADVSARERRRIGQDLHDSVGQTLTGISLLSRSLANDLGRDGHGGSSDATQISELADDASNQIRQISRGLMPTEIVKRGLLPSLCELARLTTDTCGILCEARVDESIDIGDIAVETHLFRIAQEAVHNAVRHAGAERIDIMVLEIDGVPQLIVHDDGSWKEPVGNEAGIGLKTMQYRASVIGGLLEVAGDEQGGTKVTCRLEIDEALITGM